MVYLFVDPCYVLVWLLILAERREEVVDLLNPAMCINAFAAGAELKDTVIVFAVLVVEYAEGGTPFIVM